MPYYPAETQDVDYNAKAQIASTKATPDQKKYVDDYQQGLDKSILTAGAALLGGVTLDLADTVASSVLPGVQRQDINNKFLTAVGAPGLSKFMEENRGAVELGSGIAGTVVANWAAGKLLKPAGFAMRAIREVPYAKTIANLDSQYERASRVAKLATMESAKRGTMGVDRFIGESMTLGRLGAAPIRVSQGVANSKLIQSQLAKGFVHNITTEAIMATTLHTNSMLYSDDLAHNLAWSAAGLGIGAGMDKLVGTYALRKIANSNEVRALNRRAYDPTGIEGARNAAYTTADDILKKAGFAGSGDTSWQRWGVDSVMDRATSFAIQSAELRKPKGTTERAAILGQRQEEMATPVLRMAMEEANKGTVRGLKGVAGSGFSTEAEGLGKPVIQSFELTPESMYGVSEIGAVPSERTVVGAFEERKLALDSRFANVRKMLGDDGIWKTTKVKGVGGQMVEKSELIPFAKGEREILQKEALQLHNERMGAEVVMLEPGEWSPKNWGKIADEYEPRVPEREGSLGADDLAVWQMPRKAKEEPRLGISSQGDLFLPDAARGKPENLKPQESLHLYNVANKAVREIAASDQMFVVPKDANWFVLDMAEQVLKQSGDDSKVKFWKGMTREEAMVESFAQKIDVLKRKQAAQRINAKRGIQTAVTEDDAFAMKVQLNLPRLTPHQSSLMGTGEHPIDILTHGFASGAEVRGSNYQELVKAMNDARRVTGFTDETRDTLSALHGTSYNFLRDAEGNAMKPILAVKRPQRPMEFSRDELFTRRALAEANLRDDLLGDGADEATKLWVSAMTNDPSFAKSRDVLGLADDQSRSFLPGATNAAPQSKIGAFVNSITTKARRDVDNLTMLAASQVQELKSRVTQRLARAVFDKHMGGLITDITSQRNSRSLMLINQFGSYRGGWELAKEPVEVTLQDGSTGYKFVLDHTSEMNKKRFEQSQGTALEKGQDFVNPNGQTVVLDELAMKTLTAMQGVHEETLAMKNTLLRSQGLPELKQMPWYWAPPSDKGKFVEYTFDVAGNAVPGMKIEADTASELAKMRSDLRNSPQWKDGYSLRRRDAVTSYMSLWDKAQMDFVAPNTTAIQPKKQNFGISGGNQVNMQAFQESMGTMLDSITGHGDDLVDVLFDPVIKSARARAFVAGETTQIGGKEVTQHSSIYDRYLQNLTGRSSLSSKDSFWGDPYKWLEGTMNGFLASDPVMKAATIKDRYFDYIRGAAGLDGKTLTGQNFDKFSQELGEYMPFKNVNEMMERQFGSKTPSEVADITNKLSWFEASSRLRWFETMHAMVNFGSQIANMPSVVRALQPMKGESAAEAALRNSSITMLMNVGTKEQVVLPHSMKLLWSSMVDARKSIPDEFTRKAVNLGMMDQEVAEFRRAFESIQSRAGWKGFMFGDKGRSADELSGPFKNARAKVADRGGLDHYLGMLSDKSEAFTRQWGMYAGRRVAQSMGIHDVDAQVNFSHELVNNLVANYDPRNRAEIFQGALGAPLGLFQSYTINFYQRMFRYIETQNTRALATQYATQGSIFGTSSLPGWDQLNWAFFDRGQGETKDANTDQDPIDSLVSRLGQDAGDLIQHGLLSNLPKLVGADGMAIYTRGDTQFRMPVNPINLVKGDAMVSIPMTDTIGRVVNGVGQGLAALKAMDGKIGLNQIAEIASNMITNRPIAGLIEMAGAHGYDTDQAGQVVTQTSLKSAAALYRILGTRSMAQQKEIENFYSSRNAQEEQAARKDVLNVATRQAIRDERYDAVPGLFAKYVEEGGDPRQYSAWLKRAVTAATDTRAERMLDKALKDPNNQSNAYISRLLDGEVDTAEDEGSDDDYGRDQQIQKLINDGWQTEPDAELPKPSIDESHADAPLF